MILGHISYCFLSPLPCTIPFISPWLIAECNMLMSYYMNVYHMYYMAIKLFSLSLSLSLSLSVWNVVYICSRWCYTSRSSFIPIGTLWPTLPQKIGQSHSSAFMASKIIQRLQIWYAHSYLSVLIPTDFCHGWAISGPLADKNHLKGGVTRAPSQGEVFRTLYVHVFTYQFETWHIHPVGGVTRQV